MNFEHATSEANAAFMNSSNVFVYSLKTEGAWRDLIYDGGLHNPGVALWITNSTNVNVYSHGGNARPIATGGTYPPGFAAFPPSLYRLQGSCPVRLVNLVDQFQFKPDNDWNMVRRLVYPEQRVAHNITAWFCRAPG